MYVYNKSLGLKEKMNYNNYVINFTVPKVVKSFRSII